MKYSIEPEICNLRDQIYKTQQVNYNLVDECASLKQNLAEATK